MVKKNILKLSKIVDELIQWSWVTGDDEPININEESELTHSPVLPRSNDKLF